jgi:uncharacterized lipoprotein YddW (UPF0748 family)
MFRRLLLGAALAALAGSLAADPQPLLRGIWADSWGPGILSHEQTQQLVETARRANLNAIFAEVRKVGDAYYLGGLEPRASNIAGPADYDPLQDLIDLCHDTSDGKQRIEVHAWMVTFRIWRGNLGEPPADHVVSLHPEYLMRNASDETNGDGSMFLDPGHPGAEDWTVRVYRDVAARYDVDGVHFDYVRYPEAAGDWGYNPVSLERFRRRTGFEGTPAGDDPAWRAWRREMVRDTVRRVYGEVMEANPKCLVSAATLNWGLEVNPWTWYTTSPYQGACQDWVGFMREGILDMNCLMDYSRAVTQPHRFGDWANLAMRNRGDRSVVVGPGVYLNTVDNGFAQIREAIDMGADGVLLYSYGGTNSEHVSREDYVERLRTEVFPEPAPLPARPWRDTPTLGAVIGQVTDGGEWADGATVTIDGAQSLLTDGTGFFGFYRVASGEHVVTVTRNDRDRYRETVNVTVGRAVRADFALGAD